MYAFAAEPIHLSEQQGTELRGCSVPIVARSFAFRAKVILLLAEGLSFSLIKDRLQATAPTIARTLRPVGCMARSVVALVVTMLLRQSTSTRPALNYAISSVPMLMTWTALDAGPGRALLAKRSGSDALSNAPS